jgi:glycerol-3-phosphate dehydrogenase (NAD(P)+)
VRHRHRHEHGLRPGRHVETVVVELGHVAEGVHCVQSVRQLAHRQGIAMPIVDAVARVLFDNEKPQEAIRQLLAREAREESD